MNEAEKKAKLASLPWRTPASLRALYKTAPSPELAAAIWEIYRLHGVIYEAWQRFDRGCENPAAMENSCRFGARALGQEPCIREHLNSEWLRRGEPSSRYYGMQDVSHRPEYQPPPAVDQGRKHSGDRAAKAAAERGEPPPLPLNSVGKPLRPGNRYIQK